MGNMNVQRPWDTLINSGISTAVVEVLPGKEVPTLLPAIQQTLMNKYPQPDLAKATAKHVASIAATFTAEDDNSRALQAMANCPKTDAERAIQSVLRKFDLTLNVPVTEIDINPGCTVPVLLPEHYITVLSEKGYLNKLLGGSVETRALFSNELQSSLVSA